jgi:hypothetical protein
MILWMSYYFAKDDSKSPQSQQINLEENEKDEIIDKINKTKQEIVELQSKLANLEKKNILLRILLGLGIDEEIYD